MNDTKRITVRVSHTYTASPERVFDAWLDPKKASKFPFATETGEVVRCELTLTHEGVFEEYADQTQGGWTTILAALDKTLT